MAEDTRQVRADIERTRRELGETIAALARVDVKAQAKHKADELKPVDPGPRQGQGGRAEAGGPGPGQGRRWPS